MGKRGDGTCVVSMIQIRNSRRYKGGSSVTNTRQRVENNVDIPSAFPEAGSLKGGGRTPGYGGRAERCARRPAVSPAPPAAPPPSPSFVGGSGGWFHLLHCRRVVERASRRATLAAVAAVSLACIGGCITVFLKARRQGRHQWHQRERRR
ncbi:unnamed protein product [Phaeothamnion confervicola]